MLSRKEIEERKKQAISGLKKEVENLLLENFVEKIEYWRSKMNSVNTVISSVDPEIPLYSYNEFCKKTIEITKVYLENNPDYDKLFLTSTEYQKLINDGITDENEMEQAMLKELNNKFMDNFMSVLYYTHIKESVRFKLKEKFAFVEEDLDKSFKAAEEILKKYEEKSE